MQRILLGSILALVAAVATARAGGPELKTDEEKTLYALGLWVSDKLAPFSLSEKELALVEAGMADGVLKRAKKVDLNTYGPKLNELASARLTVVAEDNKKDAQPFLEKADAEKGARKTASGLVYTELKPGSGDAPTA